MSTKHWESANYTFVASCFKIQEHCGCGGPDKQYPKSPHTFLYSTLLTIPESKYLVSNQPTRANLSFQATNGGSERHLFPPFESEHLD